VSQGCLLQLHEAYVHFKMYFLYYYLSKSIHLIACIYIVPYGMFTNKETKTHIYIPACTCAHAHSFLMP